MKKEVDEFTNAYAAYMVSVLMGEFAISPEQAEETGSLQYERAKEIAEDWGMDIGLFERLVDEHEEAMKGMDPEKWDKAKMKMADRLSVENANRLMWAIVDVGLTFGYVNEGVIGVLLKEVELLGLTLEGAVVMICARMREDKHIYLDTETTSDLMKRVLMEAIGGDGAIS